MRTIENNATATRAEVAAFVQVLELQASDDAQWDQYVRSVPCGTLFHLSSWMRVVEATLGHRCFRLAARRGESITGVFPIAWVQNRVFGSCLVSLPLAVYGGICTTDQDSFSALLKAGKELANKLGVKYLEMRNREELFPASLPGRDLYVTFRQNLSAGPEKLLQALPRDTRYMVRKSLKGDLQWTEDITLDEFYDIYARSVHRLGTPVFAKSLFAEMLKQHPGQSRVFGVRKQGTAIAAVLCLYYRDQVLPYYGGSLAEYNREAPNNFMYWNLMAQSCSEGVQWFDFGRSKRGTGAFDFKTSWGMEPVPLPYQYQLARATAVPEMSPLDRKFQLPVAVWKRMPFPMTKVLGPPLIRWIPSI